MKLHKLFSPFLFLCIPSVIYTHLAIAQNTNASLSGLVLDGSQAAIPGATVAVTNANTGVARVTQSDNAGRYLVSNLIPGSYVVSAERQGFEKNILRGITLQVGQAADLDIHMSIGSTSTTVSVSSAASVVDTQSSSEGTVIGTKPVLGLPLNQRTFYSLALLAPNVEMPAQNSTLGFRGGFNVAGQEETANTFTINGIDDNDQDVMAPSFRPSVEAIQEFNMLTGVYSANMGAPRVGRWSSSPSPAEIRFTETRSSSFGMKLPTLKTTLRRLALYPHFAGTSLAASWADLSLKTTRSFS
jgi:hypothetical protein